eukprot:jgi/Hompol1/4191/HPOL_007037-RA
MLCTAAAGLAATLVALATHVTAQSSVDIEFQVRQKPNPNTITTLKSGYVYDLKFDLGYGQFTHEMFLYQLAISYTGNPADAKSICGGAFLPKGVDYRTAGCSFFVSEDTKPTANAVFIAKWGDCKNVGGAPASCISPKGVAYYSATSSAYSVAPGLVSRCGPAAHNSVCPNSQCCSGHLG